MKKKGKLIFLFVGLLILAVLFRTFGIEKTITHILNMGWNFWIIILIYLFNHIFLSYGWKVLISQPVKHSRFYKLVLARIAGDSTSSINALGALAGEPLKAMFIKDIVPFKMGLASVILDRTIHTISNILLILTGIVVSFFLLDMPVYVKALSFLLFAGIFLLLVVVLMKQRDGFVEYLVGKVPSSLLGRFMTEERWKKVRALDEEFAYIFSSRDNLRHFYISLFVHYLSVLVAGVLEIYLIIVFIGVPISIAHALFVYIFGLFLTGAIFFMPANLGTSEGSYSIALKFLGYDPALGLSVGIIRRLRTFVWAAIGILILFYAGLLKKEVSYEEGENR